MLGGLNSGVPMLAIPQGADQFLNAETIVEHGLGLRLLPDELSPASVREAVGELLEDERYRDARPVARAVDLGDAVAGGGRPDLVIDPPRYDSRVSRMIGSSRSVFSR